jgi:hypothetical protein
LSELELKRTISASDEIGRPRFSARSAAWRRWLVPLALLIAAFALQALASRNPHLIESYYSRRVFPPISRALSRLNSVVGFSLAEWMIYVLATALVASLVYQTREVYRRRRRLAGLLASDALIALWLSGSTLLLFLLIWGLNYQREPLGGKLGFTGINASDEQLRMISESIVNEINSNYAASHLGVAVDGPGSAPLSRAQLDALIEAAYQQEPLVGAGSGAFGPAKPIYFSGALSRLGLSGFYMPFTGEPNFNAAQPDFDLPYVIAHEKAHQRGFAREEEANFIAFLVCVNSTDPHLRYSGYLNALKVVYAFSNSDPDFYQKLYQRIGQGPRGDLRARNAFWAKNQGPARAVAEKVNNSYLKANRIPSGIESYGDDVALIVGYYLKRAEATVGGH